MIDTTKFSLNLLFTQMESVHVLATHTHLHRIMDVTQTTDNRTLQSVILSLSPMQFHLPSGGRPKFFGSFWSLEAGGCDRGLPRGGSPRSMVWESGQPLLPASTLCSSIRVAALLEFFDDVCLQTSVSSLTITTSSLVTTAPWGSYFLMNFWSTWMSV